MPVILLSPSNRRREAFERRAVGQLVAGLAQADGVEDGLVIGWAFDLEQAIDRPPEPLAPRFLG